MTPYLKTDERVDEKVEWNQPCFIFKIDERTEKEAEGRYCASWKCD